VDPGSLPPALRRLDPAARALLDLSLRRGVDDESIAELLGTDAKTVANDRDRTIEEVAAAVGANRPEDRSAVREGIASLPAERWAEASPEAARRSPAAAPGDPLRPSRYAEPGDRPRPGQPVPGATDRADPSAPGPWSSGPSPRSLQVPAKRRSRVGRLALGAVLLLALAVLVGLLLNSGEDDNSAGTDAGGQTAGGDGRAGGGESTGPNGTGPQDGESEGRTEPRDPAGGGDRDGTEKGRDRGGEQPGPSAGGGGAPLAPLPGIDAAGSGTARLEGEGEEAALTLDVTGLPAPDGEYEVWLYNSLSDAVSLGRFAGRQIELFQPLPVDPADYKFLDISVEPANGNENHSGQSVLRAPLEGLRQQP